MSTEFFCACAHLIVCRHEFASTSGQFIKIHSVFTVSLEIRHFPILVVFQRGRGYRQHIHTQKHKNKNKTKPKQKQKSSTNNNDLFLYVPITLFFFYFVFDLFSPFCFIRVFFCSLLFKIRNE